MMLALVQWYGYSACKEGWGWEQNLKGIAGEGFNNYVNGQWFGMVVYGCTVQISSLHREFSHV